MWRLLPSANEFQVTRPGEFEYASFKHGEVYSKIPAEEADRFEKISGESTKDIPKKKKGGDEK